MNAPEGEQAESHARPTFRRCPLLLYRGSMASAAGAATSAAGRDVIFTGNAAGFKGSADVAHDDALNFLERVAGFGEFLHVGITHNLLAQALEGFALGFRNFFTGDLFLMQGITEIGQLRITAGGIGVLQKALDAFAGAGYAVILEEGFAQFTDFLAQIKSWPHIVVSTNNKHSGRE